MRRLLILAGVLLGILVVVVLATPLWLGAALGSFGPRYGVTFARYERLGYSRFALHGVTYRKPALKAEVTRVELTTPVVWFMQRTRGPGANITADRWKVELTPAKNETKKAPSPEGGWLQTRTLARDAVAQIDSWIDHARLSNGSLLLPAGEVSVAGLEWKDRSLALRGVTYKDFKLEADIAAPAAADELRIAARVNDGEGSVSLVSRAAEVEGQFTLWSQPGTLTARFPPTGWLPGESTVVGADWTLPGAKLKLGDRYQSVQSNTRITWQEGRLTTDVTAHGTPVEGEKLPPLEVALRTHGDLQTITIEELRTRVPGVNIDLSTPFTVNREGRIQGEPARLRFAVTLADQPWFKATGTVTGEAQLISSAASRIPQVRFQIAARDVAAEGLAIASAVARGTFVSPRVQLESASLQGSDGTQLSFSGGYDTRTREIVGATVEGEISRTTIARWLPEQPAFTKVTLKAAAEGALPDVSHRGSTRVADMTMSGVKPLDLSLEWNGTGRTLEKFSARILSGDSTITAGGSLGQDSVRLTELEFSPSGTTALRLQRPATLRWAPQLQLESLQLAGPDARVTAAVTWGKTGRAELAVQGAKSDWLAGFLTTPGPAWQLSSLAVTGAWDNGPMEFSAVAGASITLDDRRTARIHLDAGGDRDGVRLAALRAEADGNAVVDVNGVMPAVITPGATPMVKVNQKGAFALNATTVENAAFWREISARTGLTIAAPRVVARLRGTLEKPEGEVQVNVERVTFDEKRFGRSLPPVEQVKLQVHGTETGVVLDDLALTVAGQPVSARGQLPLKGGWEEVRKNPMELVKKNAELNLRIPDTDIARFKDLLPPMVLPQGRLNVDVALREGKLSGGVQLADAATRPIGATGALREIGCDIKFSGQTIDIRSLSLQTGGETVTLTGRIEVPDLETLRTKKAAVIGSLNYNLKLQGKNLPFIRTTGLLVRGDVDLKLATPQTGAPEVAGTVRLRESLFLQDVRSFLPSGTRSKSNRPPYFAVEAEPFNAWRLNIAIAGSQFMHLSATGFSGVASAQFQLGGTLGDPQLVGDATIDRGQVKFPFANFRVDEGRVSLTRADPHEPQIWIVATTRRYEFDLKLEVTGVASNPVVKFSSTPNLEHGQVLQMVVAGIVPRSDVTVTQQKRVQNLGAFIGGNLLSSFGEGDDSERLTITTGEDISERGRETYGFEFKLWDRWSLTGEYDQYDTHTVGAKWLAMSRGGRRTVLASSTESEEERAARIALGEEPEYAKPAKLDVQGLGLLGNLEMEASLRRMIGKGRRSAMSTNAIEDALFLLMSSVKEKGYLHPTVDLTVTKRDGQEVPVVVGADLDVDLPRPTLAQRVTFEVDRGQRSLVKEVHFTGLHAIRAKRARGFFAGEPGLFNRKASRIYTPARLARGAGGLADELRGLGYAEAKVKAELAGTNETTGEVDVKVEVNEGPRWKVASVQVEGADVPEVAPPNPTRHAGTPWTESLEQDIGAELRNTFLAAGYPDVRVRMSHTPPQPIAGTADQQVAVTARVEPGAKVMLGQVRYEGLGKTRATTLDRRVRNKPGEPLNLLELERARYRISRLGIFRRIDLQIEPQDGAVRDAVFRVEPGRRLELNLLAGYNTYEQLRVGAEMRQYNLWGRAHQSRMLLVQSMKSSRGEYSYTVPELFGENVHGTARLYGLRREEVAFVRQEYGVKLGIDTPLRFLGMNANAGYTFEVLSNKDNQLATSDLDRSQLEVASIDGTLTRDRRDNSLLPRKGYRIYVRGEAASPMLGGKAEYQRYELGASYHLPWGEDRWWHFAFAHGVITTLGRDDTRLPVNKRFFPGGDGSMRGYNNGEAAPRGPDGRFIGAKSVVTASVEFEQAIVHNLSGVVFVDGLGVAAKLANYPFDDTLFAVGLGVRYRTVVGPIRAEYGYNLNRRPRDPAGTFLFSIGFPF